MNTPKRIFVGLLVVSLLTVCLLFLVAWLVATKQFVLLNKIFKVLGIVILIFLGVLAFGILSLVLALLSPKPHRRLHKLILEVISFLFPMVLNIGRFLKIDQEKIKSSFISVNNQLIRNQKLVFTPQQVLILAPHCLQWSECPHKITVDVENCRRCRRCVIHSLHDLKDKYGVNFVVCTGGTLARKYVKKLRPQAVLAIACERDLTSGIQEISPLPVIGVLNIRPEGPCFNTTVNVDEVEKAIKLLLGLSSSKGQSYPLNLQSLQEKSNQLKYL